MLPSSGKCVSTKYPVRVSLPTVVERPAFVAPHSRSVVGNLLHHLRPVYLLHHVHQEPHRLNSRRHASCSRCCCQRFFARRNRYDRPNQTRLIFSLPHVVGVPCYNVKGGMNSVLQSEVQGSTALEMRRYVPIDSCQSRIASRILALLSRCC